MNTEYPHFEIGDRVVAISTDLKDGFIRIKGNEYKVLDQVSCPCGVKVIDIGNKMNSSRTYQQYGLCRCGRKHNAKDSLWHGSRHFVKIDDTGIDREIEEMFKEPILNEIE